MKRAFLLITIVAIVAAQHAALAAWLIAGNASASQTAAVLTTPNASAAVATSQTTVSVSWSPPATGPAPTAYAVYRDGSSTALVSCTGLTCDDTGLTPGTSYLYTIVAQLGSWTSQSIVSVTTPDVARAFVLSPVASQTVGTPFAVQITALAGGITDLAYNGARTVLFSGPANSPNGTVPTYPVTVTFTNGVGSATVTLVKAETAALTATEGPRTGSTPVTVSAGPGVLSFTSSTPSCATGTASIGVNSGNFISKVSRGLDTYGNTASTGPQISVALTLVQTPAQIQANKIVTVTPASVMIAAGQTESSAAFTVAYPNGLGNTTVLVTATAGGLSTSCLTTRV